MSVYFSGPFSKSLFLRALIAQSYFPKLKITGESFCDDALLMKAGSSIFITPSSSKNIRQKPCFVKDINCGASGAVFRFLALRCARETGTFRLKGSCRLFQRPLQELISVLNQLSCETKVEKNTLSLKSRGWRPAGDALTLYSERSSQFASAVFLNSWNLKQDLFVNIEGDMPSFSYFQMTLSFLRFLGMTIKGADGEYCIPAGQKITRPVYHPEPDMSCLFPLAALTGVGDGGQAIFTDFPKKSLQPDFVFLEILSKMGFQIEWENQNLKIKGAKQLKPLKQSMKNTPDLFPVLSALCAMAEGESWLHSAPHLAYKESHRIERTADLLKKIGCTVKILKDGLKIKGGSDFSKQPAFCFDPAEDHRMVMAACLLKKAGFPVRILNPSVVNKSFPNFWSLANIQP